MRKNQELSDKNSCMSKALDQEMTFVLLGRDEDSPETIRYWARRRIKRCKNKIDDPKIIEALECARTMEKERDMIKSQKSNI